MKLMSLSKIKVLTIVGVLMLCGTISVAQNQRTNKPAVPADPKIAAALREISADKIRTTVEKLVSFHTRSTLSGEIPASSGRGIVAARDWIKSEFERYSNDCGGCLDVKTDAFTQETGSRIPKPTEIVNVYAVLRGNDPANASRMVLVTGHYDSRNSTNENVTDAAPGANDDASGTAVVLECARVLSKQKFPATIVFLTVAGEEQGLYGSGHFAKLAKEQGWNLEAVLNNDIVGGNTTPGDSLQKKTVVRVFSEGIPASADAAAVKAIQAVGGENDSPSRQVARYIDGTVAPVYLKGFAPVMIFRLDRFLRGGDHLSFNQQGFAAVRITEWREDYNHQHQNVRTENGIEYGDLPKFVDFGYVANVARLNAATLASLASAPAPPANVRMLTKDLQNDTTLVWDASPGGLATGYEVLWRATDTANWQDVKNAANATRVTLPQSKDNVIFAVRAVDKDGHRSLAVVPSPER